MRSGHWLKENGGKRRKEEGKEEKERIENQRLMLEIKILFVMVPRQWLEMVLKDMWCMQRMHIMDRQQQHLHALQVFVLFFVYASHAVLCFMFVMCLNFM